ncbi:MAG: aldehyde dehydrogenase family protein, partial [Planctomycetes bacterium]|nr:aldehyde dehydrogenase family protein [Planctomycetota bacterium]
MATDQISDLLPEVRDFLSAGPLGGVIDGQDVASSDQDRFATRDPGSGEVIAEVYSMQAEQVDRAVQAAARAFAESGWAQLPPAERAAAMHRLADAVESRKPIIAQIEALDCGKLYPQAAGDVQNFVDTTRYFADMSQHVQHRSVLAVARHEAWTVRHPWGPCGFIFPWNFPILLAGWGIAPALAAGNTVVIKPAEDTPLSTIYLGRLAKEIGFPDGVINVVPGLGEVTGASLSAHPGLQRMSFTGSPEVGRLVAEACGRNLVPVKLELG